MYPKNINNVTINGRKSDSTCNVDTITAKLRNVQNGFEIE